MQSNGQHAGGPARTDGPSAHHLPSAEGARLLWLDLLRFLAAFAVVVVHARGHSFVEFGSLPAEQKTKLVFALYAITRIGSEAVTVFFVLSGFLVGGKALERIIRGQFRVGDYAVDRISRIYVPLLPALLLSALVAMYRGDAFTIGGLVGNLLGFQGLTTEPFALNGPLWSLSYEIWFYVLAGAVGVAAAYRGLHLRAAACIVGVAAIFTILEASFLFCWVIGALAWVRRPERISIGMVLLSLALIMYGVVGVEIGMVSESVKNLAIARFVPSVHVAHILLATGTALFIQQVILWQPRQAWLATLERWGTPLGAFSYTMYLVHFPLLRLLIGLGVLPNSERSPSLSASSIAAFGLLVAGAVAGSVALYVLFERHTPKVRRWMRARWGTSRR